MLTYEKEGEIFGFTTEFVFGVTTRYQSEVFANIGVAKVVVEYRPTELDGGSKRVSGEVGIVRGRITTDSEENVTYDLGFGLSLPFGSEKKVPEVGGHSPGTPGKTCRVRTDLIVIIRTRLLRLRQTEFPHRWEFCRQSNFN